MFGFMRRIRLKSKLLFSFAVVLLIPGILIGTLSYETAKDKVSGQLINSANENVAFLDHVITSSISARMKDLDFITTVITQNDLQGKNPAVLRYLDDYMKLHPDINTIFLGTSSGGFFNSPRVKMADDFDPRVRPWYVEAAKDKNKVSVTAPYISKTTGDFVIALSKVLKDGSGTVGAEIKLKDLDELTKSVQIGDHGYAMLIDQDRKVIVNRQLEAGAELKTEWADTVFASKEGDITVGAGQDAIRIRFGTNELTGWKIGGVIEDRELSEKAAPILNRMLLVLAVSFVVFGGLAYVLVWLITRPLKELEGAAAQISQGDLTIRAHIRSKDEIGRLGASFNAMADSLQTLLSQIGELSIQVAASSEQLTASADQTSRATEQIAESTQEVAASAGVQVESVDMGLGSIRRMADGIGRIVEGSQTVSRSSAEASGHTEEGSAAMAEAVERMESIHDQVERLEKAIRMLQERSAAIGQIAELMTGIAQQTNILSINAAIEASRAGEQGRGFAVVAQEVKKLAEQSRESAEEIREMIGKIQVETADAAKVTDHVVDGVTQGSSSIRRAGDLFGSIKARLQQMAKQSKTMTEAVESISKESGHAVEAMEQVSRTTDVTADSTHQVSAAAQEQLASMEEIASSSAALAKMAEEMQLLIAKFKV